MGIYRLKDNNIHLFCVTKTCLSSEHTRIITSSPEHVEEDVACAELVPGGEDLLGDGGGVGECGRLLADLADVEQDVLAVGALQDDARLVSDADDLVVALWRVVAADALGDARVDGAAEAAVRSDGHQQLARVRRRLLGADLSSLVERL